MVYKQIALSILCVFLTAQAFLSQNNDSTLQAKRNSEIRELKLQLDEAKSTREQLNIELEKSKIEISHIKSQLSDEKDFNDLYRKKHLDYLVIIKTDSIAKAELQAKINGLELKHSNLESYKAQLLKENQIKGNLIKALENQNDSVARRFKVQLQQERKATEGAKTNYEESESENRALAEKYKTAYDELTQVTSKLDTLKKMYGDSLALLNKNFKAQVKKYNQGVRLVSMIVLGVAVLAILIYLVWFYFDNKKLRSAEMRKLQMNVTLLADVGVHVHYITEIKNRYIYYLGLAQMSKHIMKGSIILSVLYGIAIFIELYVHVFSNATVADTRELRELVNDNFWKMVAALATPVVFAVTLYNTMETKVIDAANMLCELELDSVSRSPIQPMGNRDQL